MRENRMSVLLTDRLRWVLVIVKLAEKVEGTTRLQKLAFLVSQNVKELGRYKFYDIWEAGKYGPYSRELTDDIEMAKQQRILGVWPVKNGSGFPVDNYMLTDDGMKIASEISDSDRKVTAQIREIVEQYSKSSLMSILYDVYIQYPQYTSGSVIKSQVARASGYQDTLLDRQYD